MAKNITTLTRFVREVVELLQTVSQCGPVLFRRKFRTDFNRALSEALEGLNAGRTSPEFEVNEDDNGTLVRAGLTGAQLRMKLNSFSHTLAEFEKDGSGRSLDLSLAKSSIILGSMAGAIPGFGSFLQELVEFVLKELHRKSDSKLNSN
jgi:hypothetical protein